MEDRKDNLGWKILRREWSLH